ncbi:MAG: anti-sigma factor [Actinomycetota bacterium]|nr:anti-sigma factor [Actinomycetota bacterium]
MSNEELTERERALIAEFDDLLADPSLWAVPDPELEDRVVAAITVEAERSAPAGSVTRRYSAVPSRRRRWLATSGASAVGAAAAVVFTLIATRDSSTPADATVAMTGTDLAPGVVGSAGITSGASGVEIHLEVPGLPRRDGGEFYQVWLKNCDGSELVPAGSFHELDWAIAWAGVSTDDFPLITVTKEVAAAPTDPAQGSSGEVVVAGAVAPCPT